MGRALNGAVLRLMASAGPGEGRGHLARALALAEAAQDLGVACTITLRRGEPSMAERVRATASGAAFVPLEHRAGRTDRLIVDLPDPNEPGAAVLAGATVLDDRELLASPARVVVQPSQPEWTPAPGAGASRVLAGYALAPLGRALLAARGRGIRQAKSPGRGGVLVCFGGSDPADVGGRLLPSLRAAGLPGLTVVVGPDYRGALIPDGIEVVREPPDLPLRLASAEVAVLGAGTMKFEAAALGVPAVLVGVVDDQLPVGPRFAQTGAAIWAGDGRRADPVRVAEVVQSLVGDPGRRAAMAVIARATVPGGGARSIVVATLPEAGRQTGRPA